MANSVVPEEDWQLARRGLSLFLNNKPEEAENLFGLRSNSFHIKSARCFVLFMNALMTFEEEKLAMAVEMLRDTERECTADTSWFKSITSKVFGSEENGAGMEYARRLERQIVVADTKVCHAMLTLVQQQVSGYVHGGWMMRKAWRAYQQTYTQVLELYRRTFGSNPTGVDLDYRGRRDPRNCHSNSMSSSCSSFWYHHQDGENDEAEAMQSRTAASTPTTLSSSSNGATRSTPTSLRTSLSMFLSLTGIATAAAAATNSTNASDQRSTNNPFIEPAQVVRLMSAVSFGYGIFQLCVSLVPPSLLKLIHVLGFEGDKKAGLSALMYARMSEDMRAPLATLSLLCYHTIIRPFCSLHDSSVRSSVETAKKLIAESQMEFNDAALFLFFTGRTERLESNIEAAIEAYGRAIRGSAQREVVLLCLHEVAWCHLIRLDYSQARFSFARLQRESRWSESIYAYLAAVCAGSDANAESISTVHRGITVNLGALATASSSKSTQLDLFVSKRVAKLINENNGSGDHRRHSSSIWPSSSYYKFLSYELLYLWNALPSSSRESLVTIVTECKDNRNDEPMIGLADLVAGAAYSCLGQHTAALQSYRNCLEQRRCVGCTAGISNDTQDRHVSAFALYELGTILCATNRTEEGKTALIEAQTGYSQYDFESRLNIRIHSALKALA